MYYPSEHIITEVFYFFNPTKWTFKILKSGGDNFFIFNLFRSLSFTKKMDRYLEKLSFNKEMGISTRIGGIVA
jgi:hypothetical protein